MQENDWKAAATHPLCVQMTSADRDPQMLDVHMRGSESSIDRGGYEHGARPVREDSFDTVAGVLPGTTSVRSDPD